MRHALVALVLLVACVPGRDRHGFLPPLTDDPHVPVVGSDLQGDAGGHYLLPGEILTLYPSGRSIVRRPLERYDPEAP